ncbi:U32 family peptidase [Candidatus Poribacteria bacterium]|nr:U32 family peptidase [Candidatus Poribacteria bacterium]
MYKPELVAPAGNYEKLKTAIQYGADAVYLGDSKYSLRACADNFTIEEIKIAIDYAHSHSKKTYVTINVFPHNYEFEDLKNYVLTLVNIGIDGVVISDPGVFMMVRDVAPSLRIHISTQANTFNYQAAKFWEKQGASRIILARELTYEEIAVIRENTSIELEVFVHGAMCMSWSGRCMLSNYMVGRDANHGDCAHPCRYSYKLAEEKRPGQYFPIEEDNRGTYILSSRDLCTIEHIHKFLKIGINGFKIEGRMKGIYYLAIVTKTYHEAIAEYLKNPEHYEFNPEWKEELLSISHREYIAGFYFEKENFNLQTYLPSAYIQKYDLVGVVKSKHGDAFVIEIRNKLSVNDEIEIFAPEDKFLLQKITEIHDVFGNKINEGQTNNQVVINLKGNLKEGYLLRRKRKDTNGES